MPLGDTGTKNLNSAGRKHFSTDSNGAAGRPQKIPSSGTKDSSTQNATTSWGEVPRLVVMRQFGVLFDSEYDDFGHGRGFPGLGREGRNRVRFRFSGQFTIDAH
jgi:hypothetical protein